MISKLKKLFLVVASTFALAVPVLAPVAVYAATDTIGPALSCGADLDVSKTSGCTNDTSSAGTKLQPVIKQIINIFSVIVGVIAVVMIIVGGLKYITSGGESSNISGAKNTIIYAVVGLVVVALAQFIVHFVLSNVNGVQSGS